MILNAKIKSADIYIEDHDILTFSIFVETSAGWSVGIGNYSLDYTKNNKRIPEKNTATIIREILEVVGVRSWSDLPGKYIRLDDNDRHNSSITKIGHIVEDRWIDISEIMSRLDISDLLV